MKYVKSMIVCAVHRTAKVCQKCLKIGKCWSLWKSLECQWEEVSCLPTNTLYKICTGCLRPAMWLPSCHGHVPLGKSLTFSEPLLLLHLWRASVVPGDPRGKPPSLCPLISRILMEASCSGLGAAVGTHNSRGSGKGWHVASAAFFPVWVTGSVAQKGLGAHSSFEQIRHWVLQRMV